MLGILKQGQFGFLALASRVSLLLALAICVVVPHSFQIPTAIAISAAFLFSLPGLQLSQWLTWQIAVYCLGAVVTVVYLFVGFQNGAPTDAIVQNAIVYIVSPLMWLILSAALLQRFGSEGVVRWLVILTWLALISVILFFWAYLTFGREAVKFLTEDANINVRGGFAGSTMLVYGSMIFLAGAIFAEPNVVRSRIGRFFLPAALIAAAATSGRAAFLIAIPVGIIVGLVLRPGLATSQKDGKAALPLLPIIGMLIAITLGVITLNAVFTQLDLWFIAELFWNKLSSGGGNERVQQYYALWEGIEGSWGLGRGHGVGVDYVRSDEFPWRYELLPLATIFRVGFIGLTVYAAPFLLAAYKIIQKFRNGDLSRIDIYMTGGLLSALFATFTNPYLESFTFQYMYFLPVIVIGFVNHSNLNLKGSKTSHRKQATHLRSETR